MAPHPPYGQRRAPCCFEKWPNPHGVAARQSMDLTAGHPAHFTDFQLISDWLRGLLRRFEEALQKTF